MKPIMIEFNNSSSESLYIQLYKKLRDLILSGDISAGEKLPSLRNLSESLNISITTARSAYDQLLVEGYIFSRPQSGYYAAHDLSSGPISSSSAQTPSQELSETGESNPFICDSDCFNFVKWKKCSSQVFNEYSDLLLFESDPQGEATLRFEISRYVYSSRGVTCNSDQIIIGAGTQQITGHLCRILKKMDINLISLESPGYLPVQNMFRDSGFAVSHIDVTRDGIDIQRLPSNISSAVYVVPSNQFPTGAVMPIGRRRQLLSWAFANDSIIIEDDYDSELRYFGKPIPSLKSLDEQGHVVYLGSFSSTLFPAVKISYMVLPEPMALIYRTMKDRYTQTCSKAEQLTLALFMKKGYYYTGIRKLRSLYSQKLFLTLQTFSAIRPENIKVTHTKSGINLILKIRTKKTADELCLEAKSIGLQMIPLSELTDQETASVIFYYSKLPLSSIQSMIEKLIRIWNDQV